MLFLWISFVPYTLVVGYLVSTIAFFLTKLLARKQQVL